MTSSTAAEAGRSCPYCRFALKEGVLVQRCAVCTSVHHEDCWNDGGGCAIFGCAGAGTAPAAKVASQVYPPPPPPPRGVAPVAPPPGEPSKSTRGLLIAVIAVLAVGIAAAGGYLLTSKSGEEPASASTDTSPAARATPAPTESAPDEPDPEPTVDPQVRAKRSAQRIEAIIAFSQEGRTEVREGRFADAVANRRTVLRRLRAIRGTTGKLATAKRTLERAMRASLQSDIAYQNGTSAAASDAEATRLKAAFARQWGPVAATHGLDEYAPGDI